MKLLITVKSKAKKNLVKQIDSTHLTVYTTAVPIEGKANRAVVKLIAKNFNVAPSRVIISSGEKSKQKVIQII